MPAANGICEIPQVLACCESRVCSCPLNHSSLLVYAAPAEGSPHRCLARLAAAAATEGTERAGTTPHDPFVRAGRCPLGPGPRTTPRHAKPCWARAAPPLTLAPPPAAAHSGSSSP